MKLGYILNYSSIPDTEFNPQKRLTVRLHLKGVTVRPFRGSESKDATKYFTRKSGQLIYGKQNIFRGSIGIVPDELDGFSSSQDIPAFDISNSVHTKWLFWYLSQPSYYKYLENFAAGSGSKRLHPKEFFKMPIPVPPIIEQERISALLDTASGEIKTLKALAEKYREQKRGLMQKLLSGEWQIPNSKKGAA